METIISIGTGDPVDIGDFDLYDIDITTPTNKWSDVVEVIFDADLWCIIPFPETIDINTSQLIMIGLDFVRLIGFDNPQATEHMDISLYAYKQEIDGDTEFQDYEAGTLIKDSIIKTTCNVDNVGANFTGAANEESNFGFGFDRMIGSVILLHSDVSVSEANGLFMKVSNDFTGNSTNGITSKVIESPRVIDTTGIWRQN